MTLFSLVTLLAICLPYAYSESTTLSVADGYSIPHRGKWEYPLSERSIGIPRSLFAGSNIFIQISCNSHDGQVGVEVVLRKLECLNSYTYMGELGQLQNKMFLDSTLYKKYNCSDQIIPQGILYSVGNQLVPKNSSKTSTAVYTTEEDGVYYLIVSLRPMSSTVSGVVSIKLKGPHGYLAAVEYPLLPFYAVMCVVYAMCCLFWLIISFLQWRDLLRIQFWIGGVIFIGLVEKALFYEEFRSVNTTGESSFLGTVFFAELVSAAKRSLARILVIIVSLGYGIVKPRLGSHFPKIIAVGVGYFALASIEAYLRVIRTKDEPSEYLLLATIPLALVDSLICWWIFSSLVQTTRTLRLRRNLVKLQLYNYFTNTLIIAVIASTFFMLYSIKTHRITSCLTDWSQLWMDDAFWHVQFSAIVVVIMVLWRPTNNNQRYAFSPLLDAPDDEDDDEEVEHFVQDAYGVKMRGIGSRSDSPKQRSNIDDDLKWVEENIPNSLIDTSLPVLDSDEELMNTKFEISKMQ